MPNDEKMNQIPWKFSAAKSQGPRRPHGKVVGDNRQIIPANYHSGDTPINQRSPIATRLTNSNHFKILWSRHCKYIKVYDHSQRWAHPADDKSWRGGCQTAGREITRPTGSPSRSHFKLFPKISLSSRPQRSTLSQPFNRRNNPTGQTSTTSSPAKNVPKRRK